MKTEGRGRICEYQNCYNSSIL